jgi:hypothetical protein
MPIVMALRLLGFFVHNVAVSKGFTDKHRDGLRRRRG